MGESAPWDEPRSMEGLRPSVLFFGRGLSKSSHLWMRRMLSGLASDVGVVVTDDLAGNIAAAGYRTRLVTKRHPAVWHRIGARLHICRSRWPSDLVSDELQQESTQVGLFHFLHESIGFDAAFANCNKPIFIHCHGYDVTWEMRSHDGSGRVAHRDGYTERVRKLPRNVQFIANSVECQNRLLDIGIEPERIKVKYLGVEVPAGRPNIRKDEGDCVLFLSRLVDCKGPDLTLRAFEIACDRGFRGRLIIAGDGPLRFTCELIRARSRYADRISIVGSVNQEAGERLRSEATIFTAHSCQGPLTGQVEAFGVSFLEAMAAGLPVVTGRCGGVPELIEDDHHGILFDPGDVDAHAEALLKLQRNPEIRNAIGSAARQRVLECFTIEKELRTLRTILGLERAAI